MDSLSPPIESMLMKGLGRNGLFLFLIANLMTGATNLSIHTLYASDLQAFLILSLYLTSLTVVTIFLHKNEITLKFW